MDWVYSRSIFVTLIPRFKLKVLERAGLIDFSSTCLVSSPALHVTLIQLHTLSVFNSFSSFALVSWIMLICIFLVHSNRERLTLTFAFGFIFKTETFPL